MKVDLLLSAVPEEVAGVDVTIAYPDRSLPNAVQTIALSRAKPSGSYLLSTGSAGPIQPYAISKSFRMTDGDLVTTPSETSNAAMLAMSSPFKAPVETTFVASGDFQHQIDLIVVSAVYEEPENALIERETLVLDQATRVQAWRILPVRTEPRTFRYTTKVRRKDGSEHASEHTATLGDQVTVGATGAVALPITVDAELLDWTKYARALVTLSYADPANRVAHSERLVFSPPSTPMVQTPDLPDRGPAAHTFRLRNPARRHEPGRRPDRRAGVDRRHLRDRSLGRAGRWRDRRRRSSSSAAPGRASRG